MDVLSHQDSNNAPILQIASYYLYHNTIPVGTVSSEPGTFGTAKC